MIKLEDGALRYTGFLVVVQPHWTDPDRWEIRKQQCSGGGPELHVSPIIYERMKAETENWSPDFCKAARKRLEILTLQLGVGSGDKFFLIAENYVDGSQFNIPSPDYPHRLYRDLATGNFMMVRPDLSGTYHVPLTGFDLLRERG